MLRSKLSYSLLVVTLVIAAAMAEVAVSTLASYGETYTIPFVAGSTAVYTYSFPALGTDKFLAINSTASLQTIALTTCHTRSWMGVAAEAQWFACPQGVVSNCSMVFSPVSRYNCPVFLQVPASAVPTQNLTFTLYFKQYTAGTFDISVPSIIFTGNYCPDTPIVKIKIPSGLPKETVSSATACSYTGQPPYFMKIGDGYTYETYSYAYQDQQDPSGFYWMSLSCGPAWDYHNITLNLKTKGPLVLDSVTTVIDTPIACKQVVTFEIHHTSANAQTRTATIAITVSGNVATTQRLLPNQFGANGVAKVVLSGSNADYRMKVEVLSFSDMTFRAIPSLNETMVRLGANEMGYVDGLYSSFVGVFTLERSMITSNAAFTLYAGTTTSSSINSGSFWNGVSKTSDWICVPFDIPSSRLFVAFTDSSVSYRGGITEPIEIVPGPRNQTIEVAANAKIVIRAPATSNFPVQVIFYPNSTYAASGVYILGYNTSCILTGEYWMLSTLVSTAVVLNGPHDVLLAYSSGNATLSFLATEITNAPSFVPKAAPATSVSTVEWTWSEQQPNITVDVLVGIRLTVKAMVPSQDAFSIRYDLPVPSFQSIESVNGGQLATIVLEPTYTSYQVTIIIADFGIAGQCQSTSEVCAKYVPMTPRFWTPVYEGERFVNESFAFLDENFPSTSAECRQAIEEMTCRLVHKSCDSFGRSVYGCISDCRSRIASSCSNLPSYLIAQACDYQGSCGMASPPTAQTSVGSPSSTGGSPLSNSSLTPSGSSTNSPAAPGSSTNTVVVNSSSKLGMQWFSFSMAVFLVVYAMLI